MAAKIQGPYPPPVMGGNPPPMMGENPPPYPQSPTGPGFAAPPPGPGPYSPGPAPPPQAGYQYRAAPVQPPAGLYVPGQTVTVQPVVGQQVVIVQQHTFRQNPVNTVCPHCSHQVITSTTGEVGGLAWVLCLAMFFFGLWVCCFIPFCLPDCQDIRHDCPNCKRTIHVFRRM